MQPLTAFLLHLVEVLGVLKSVPELLSLLLLGGILLLVVLVVVVLAFGFVVLCFLLCVVLLLFAFLLFFFAFLLFFTLLFLLVVFALFLLVVVVLLVAAFSGSQPRYLYPFRGFGVRFRYRTPVRSNSSCSARHLLHAGFVQPSAPDHPSVPGIPQPPWPCGLRYSSGGPAGGHGPR